MGNEIEAKAARVRDRLDQITKEIGKAIVGHDQIIEDVLVCLLCKGHALIEGVPGLGKTYLIRTLGEVLDLSTSRIQFTPDLMPADILGTNVLVRGEGDVNDIVFQRGPVFSQVLLADEINRATPKTQSALLEAMQEDAVTIGGHSYPLEPPFIVLATQNPLEMEGTYPLPEAQLDRFFYKLAIDFPSADTIEEILDRTTGSTSLDLETVLSHADIIEMQEFVRDVPLPSDVKKYAVKLVMSTHPQEAGAHESIKRFVRYGSSPRGAQSLVLAGKVYALIDGRLNVDYADIQKAALPSLRHRIILSFEGEAAGVTPEQLIKDIVERTRSG